MLDQGAVVAGYELEDVLGRGGMGTVFRARHVASGRVVALKLLAGDGRLEEGWDVRLHGEGRAQAALDHPHVVTVYDAGTSEQGPYLAMQLVEGPSLGELLHDRRVDARRALRLLEQVAGALDELHARGLVHRDVKPRNVLVGARDHGYLADFGLTRGPAEAALTAPGAVVGTFAYVAPEVVRGEEAGPAADRYAFAAMAFECLTGTVPFPRTSGAAMLRAHADDPPPSAGARRPELGDGLDELLARALAKDPADRPDTAARLVDALRRRMERDGTIALPPPAPAGAAALRRPDGTTSAGILPDRPARAGRPRRSLVALAAAALAGAAVALAAALVLDEDPVPRAGPPAVAETPGLRYVGAALTGRPGRALDCNGRPLHAGSPGCTIVQSARPGATVVVPADGVLRRWGVRAARGELTLAVLRPREGGAFQIGLSNTETVGSADVQWFDSDMAVERGDLVALRVSPGSAVGVRDGVRGATTDRWLPAVGGFGRPADRGAGTGFDHELLLRVGLRPGGRPRADPKLTGSAAAREPAGRVLRRTRVRIGGRPLELALVHDGSRFAVDQRLGGRRVARIFVPGMRPGAAIVRFKAAAWTATAGGLDVTFVNAESARAVQLGYDVTPGALARIR